MKIEVQDFNVGFGNSQILKNINIKIPKNTVTALIGPSGCGKSTFLRSINRMNDISRDFNYSGSIYINSVNIYGEEIDVVNLRKNVGMVFQKANPFPMSIYDNVAYGLRIHGMRDNYEISKIVEKSLKGFVNN